MKKSPCATCDRKGCGSYHDECPDYQKWVSDGRDNKKNIPATRDTKPHMERSKSFRASKNCTVFKTHRR